MILDHEHYLIFIRQSLIRFITPLQYSMNYVTQFIETLNLNLLNHKQLIIENIALRKQQLLLQTKLQKMLILEKENHDLYALLKASSSISNERTLLAKVLRLESDFLVSEIIINKGKDAGVYIGQPVIDAYGIVGQVIEIGSSTSRVLLLTDSRSAIPVQDIRTGVRGIVVGQGRFAKLALINVLGTVDIKTNDNLVSSGIDQHYPSGYPVGTVFSIHLSQIDSFVKMEVSPSAQLERSSFVLLLWPKKQPIIDVPKNQGTEKDIKKINDDNDDEE